MINRGLFMTPGRRGAVDDLGAAHRGRRPEVHRRVRRLLRRSSPADARTSREPHGPALRAGPWRFRIHERSADAGDAPLHRRRPRTSPRALEAYARDRIANLPAARPPGLARGADRRARARRSPPRASGASRRCASGPTCWRRPRSRRTTRRPRVRARVPRRGRRVLFDLVVGASSTIAAGWIDGAGAIWAENQALRWIADLVGLPPGGGRRASCRAARPGTCRRWSRPDTTRRRPARRTARRAGGSPPATPRTPASPSAAARDGRGRASTVPHDERGRLTGERAGRRARRRRASTASSPSWRAPDRRTPGPSTTSPASPTSARDRGVWFHVDGAYGGAGAPRSVRPRTASDGIERADSFIVDPHKWLFAPYDACALLYRDPVARAGGAPAGRLVPGHGARPARIGTRPTTRTTCPAARAGCRCGSRSPRTAPTPTARRSRRVLTITRETAAAIRGTPELELLHGARALRGALPADRMGTRRLRGVVAPALDAQIALRPAHVVEGREGRAPVLREPAHHDGARPRPCWTRCA